MQARSVLYAYTHVRTWSDQKILKFLAIVSTFNILLARNQDFVMKTEFLTFLNFTLNQWAALLRTVLVVKLFYFLLRVSCG